jgi:hypothetical protein
MSESQYTTVLEAHRATIEKAIDCFIGAYEYGRLEEMRHIEKPTITVESRARDIFFWMVYVYFQLGNTPLKTPIDEYIKIMTVDNIYDILVKL